MIKTNYQMIMYMYEAPYLLLSLIVIALPTRHQYDSKSKATSILLHDDYRLLGSLTSKILRLS